MSESDYEFNIGDRVRYVNAEFDNEVGARYIKARRTSAGGTQLYDLSVGVDDNNIVGIGIKAHELFFAPESVPVKRQSFAIGDKVKFTDPRAIQKTMTIIGFRCDVGGNARICGDGGIRRLTAKEVEEDIAAEIKAKDEELQRALDTLNRVNAERAALISKLGGK